MYRWERKRKFEIFHYFLFSNSNHKIKLSRHSTWKKVECSQWPLLVDCGDEGRSLLPEDAKYKDEIVPGFEKNGRKTRGK